MNRDAILAALRPLESFQSAVEGEARRRWPASYTIGNEGLALAEEAGEVCRAILKRAEGTRGTPEEWTAAVRKEVGQVFLVLCGISSLEEFSLAEAAVDALMALFEKPETEAMDGTPIATFDAQGTVEYVRETGFEAAQGQGEKTAGCPIVIGSAISGHVCDLPMPCPSHGPTPEF